MNRSTARALALRRQILVLEASAQRLRLQRDVSRLIAAASPAALAQRAWQEVRARPALAWLPLVAIVVLFRAGAKGRVGKLLLWWRAWQTMRGFLQR